VLTFERPTPADLPGYERVFLDPRVQPTLAPPPLPPWDRATVAARLEGDIAHWDEHGFGPWALHDDGYAGRGGLAWRDLNGRRVVEIAWAVAPDRWGRGLATRTALQAIDRARDLGIAELVAFTLPTNVASERVMQKAGMERVGPIEHAGLPHVLYRFRL
jgi:ribosomal-protein-alanine N-acetyltransferase